MNRILLCICWFLLSSVNLFGDPVPPLWYAQPATEWEEALPIGNGRLAAMVFGKTGTERIQFNEESLWSGAPQDADSPNALSALPKIRQLLLQGNHEEAQNLTYENLLCKGPGSCHGKGADGDFGCYQTFGDLILSFSEQGTVDNYRRELDLNTAITRVTYSIGDAHHTREYFVSAPDQVIIVHLTCDKPGKISFTADLTRPECATVRQEASDTLVMEGQLYADKGVKFAAKLRALAQHGTISSTENTLTVDRADSVILLLAAATNFKGKPHDAIISKQICLASQKTLSQLRQAHVSEYQSFFQRAELSLDGPNLEAIPTDQRLQAIKDGFLDPKLLAQYFQFGRYLLISSSRPGCLPANLQGKWAHLIQTPWNCDYHTNINLQMNYWPAEVTNLADCHEPLLDFIATLQEPGRRTAKIHYGARGWATHHITNVWGFTSPAESAKWGLFPAAGGWLCQHFWEHYAFSQNKAYLKQVYPIMKECAQFYLDFLIEEPTHQWLVTAPSSSPENQFFTADGKQFSVCLGPSMDLQIISDLFFHTSQSANILNIDSKFAAKLDKTRSKLAPSQIGKHGQLQEWLEDFDEPEPGHRNISHLFALYPGHQISLTKTPEFAQAARTSLERRLQYGGGQTGWSQAWIVNFWARLREGEKAHQHLNALLAQSVMTNLFVTHPPFKPHKNPLFQIDGNFGGTAGIAEMLIQSHEDSIHLLPSLPTAWSTGHYKGFRARGGVEVDVKWENGKIITAKLRPSKTGQFVIRFPKDSKLTSIQPARKHPSISNGTTTLNMKAGKEYTLTFHSG